MRKVCVVAAFLLAFGAVAQAGFEGPYAPGNWTLYVADDGWGTLDVDTMFVMGTDSGGFYSETEYYITAPADAVLEFDWDYGTYDSPGYDWCYYKVGGAKTILAYDFASGSEVVNVSAGDVFALGVESQDGCCGAGYLTVTEFVPEPASLLLLGLGVFALRRR